MTIKNKILWFCRTGDSSSLARITDSIIPPMTEKFEITLLCNKTDKIMNGVKYIFTGANTSSIAYVDFIKSQPRNGQDIRSLNMKYIMIQIVDELYENDYTHLLICNGVYETNIFAEYLTKQENFLMNKNGNKTKLVCYCPFDYIISKETIENIAKSDILITMTPIMQKELENIGVKSKWVGHGSDIPNNIIDRKELVIKINKLKVYKKYPIEEDDIIVLNANNYGPLKDNETSVENTPGTRKRLDITLKALIELRKINKKVKLWIHTSIKNFLKMLNILKIDLKSLNDFLILSDNTFTNEELSYLYQVCKISLQTSTGEGWSLTNLEASLFRSLQIVPDFLACGYHYAENRGLLIPVTRKSIKNEYGFDVIIGEVSVEDTITQLIKALELMERKNEKELNEILNNAYIYASQFTWKKSSEQLIDCLI